MENSFLLISRNLPFVLCWAVKVLFQTQGMGGKPRRSEVDHSGYNHNNQNKQTSTFTCCQPSSLLATPGKANLYRLIIFQVLNCKNYDCCSRGYSHKKTTFHGLLPVKTLKTKEPRSNRTTNFRKAKHVHEHLRMAAKKEHVFLKSRE